MARIYGVLSILSFAFTLYCLLDVVLTDSSRVRNLPKLTWVLMIIILPLIGGVVWLVGGRPQETSFAPGGAPSGPGRGRRSGGSSRPKGPDDDPRFLRELDARLRGAGAGGVGGDQPEDDQPEDDEPEDDEAAEGDAAEDD